MIGVVDYGGANHASVVNAVDNLGFDYFISDNQKSLDNAEKKVESLKLEGYPAELAQSNPDGLYRAAYGRYSTKKEAINMLYFLKYTLEEEAWYLEER